MSIDEMRQRCHNYNVNACAEYDVRGGICRIWAQASEQDTPEWLRWHELLHCAGWDHKEQPYYMEMRIH